MTGSPAAKKAISFLLLACLAVLAAGAAPAVEEPGVPLPPPPPSVAPQPPTVAPFRDELLGKVTVGTPDERRKYAELLPLRILVAYGDRAQAEEDSGYQMLKDTLGYIEKNNVVEAADILEPALKRGNGLFHEDQRVSDLWLKLKTHGMSDEKKAEFMAGLLAPGVDNWAWNCLGEEYPKLGGAGRKPLLSMLETADAEMTHNDDRLKATKVAAFLSMEALRPTEGEVETLLKRDSLYVKCVMFGYLARKRDARALRLVKEIWEAVPAGHPSCARSVANAFTLVPQDNVAPVLVWMLGKLDADERMLVDSGSAAQEAAHMVCYLRKRILYSAINAGAKGQSRELRQYLQEYVKRPLELKDGMNSEEVANFCDEYSVRALAKSLLKEWKGER